jgi:hypothetical protein
VKAEGLEELGFAIVVGVGSVEQIVIDFLRLHQDSFCVRKFHAMKV